MNEAKPIERPVLCLTDIETNVRALLPEISTRSAEFEAERRLPTDVIDKLKRAGCFRMHVLEAFGGAQLDISQSLPIVEMLAAADGSTGWLVALGSETPGILSRCTPGAFEALYAKGPDLICAGGATPTGIADVVDGDYRVTGRWAWASGSLHADLMVCSCVIREKGIPRTTASGEPEVRMVVVPRSDARVLDTWHVNGLRATGSNDVVIEDAIVPDGYTLELMAGEPSIPNSIYRGAMVQGALHLAAVAVGIAQGALDAVVAQIRTTPRAANTTRAAELPLLHFRLGEADTRLRAARALLYSQARAFVENIDSLPRGGAQLAHPLTVACVSAAAWIANEAARLVDIAYHAGGGAALRDSSPLQRRLRDAHTVTQHVILSDAMVSRQGAALGRTG
jgi:alkylation response protein AidB-like acyl-CoA dehydrogenase